MDVCCPAAPGGVNANKVENVKREVILNSNQSVIFSLPPRETAPSMYDPPSSKSVSESNSPVESALNLPTITLGEKIEAYQANRTADTFYLGSEAVTASPKGPPNNGQDPRWGVYKAVQSLRFFGNLTIADILKSPVLFLGQVWGFGLNLLRSIYSRSRGRPLPGVDPTPIGPPDPQRVEPQPPRHGKLPFDPSFWKFFPHHQRSNIRMAVSNIARCRRVKGDPEPCLNNRRIRSYITEAGWKEGIIRNKVDPVSYTHLTLPTTPYV